MQIHELSQHKKTVTHRLTHLESGSQSCHGAAGVYGLHVTAWRAREMRRDARTVIALHYSVWLSLIAAVHWKLILDYFSRSLTLRVLGLILTKVIALMHFLLL